MDGDEYQARFDALARSGADVHGEADFVESLDPKPERVLDAGCGTGRVAIELAARGVEVVGVDVDASMLDTARRRAPSLEWVAADLVTCDVRGGALFDVVVAAGNVMIFVAPGTESAVVANMAAHLAEGGRLVSGFQVGRLSIDAYDAACESAGLELEARYATWDRDTWRPGGGYAVNVHRRA